MIFSRWLRGLALCAGPILSLAAGLAAQEREEILSYDVTVEIADGGRMDVTEEISVRALGDEIRRGIYRDFPTSFPRASGLGRIEAPFEVVEVRRDGAPEPYAVQSIGGPLGRGGVRIRIGNADRTLEPGVYTYTIRYTTWRWVAFGEDADQLYWNVTGNGWGFPILRASARLRLPRPVDPGAVTLESWSGPEGSTTTSAEAAWDAEAGLARFATETPLAPGEGLTVRVTFPRGVVQPPTEEVQATWFRMDWGGWIDAASVVGLLLALYLFMWSRVGRDPARGPVVVRYEPPRGFSPAALGYLKRRGWNDPLLAAGLVSLAVKGAVRIERDGRDWTLLRIGGPNPETTSDERTLFNGLLSDREALALRPRHAGTIRKSVKAFRAELKRQLEREHFVLNRRWFGVGLALSVSGLAALAWRDRYGIPPEAWFFCLWLSFWSIGVGTLLTRAWRAWRSALGAGGIGSWAEAIFLTLFSTPFVGAEIFVAAMLAMRVPQHLVGAAIGLGLLNVVFYHLLERPTLRGRGVMNELDGFEAFLTATDADRLDRMTEPDRTPALFERYLPHAIALGVENRWAERFQGALVTPSGGGSGVAPPPSWYVGSDVGDVSSIASSLGGAFSSTLSSASSPPSSGGGSGGGGSSGGGGGGGGGGGW